MQKMQSQDNGVNMKHFLILSLIAGFVSCSGGSSSGTLITGNLTQSGAVNHSFRHDAGEKIEDVEICALGQCSTTDSEGQWGFEVDTRNVKEATFSIKGHGIDTTTNVEIESGANQIEIEFKHDDGKVEAHSVVADGHEHTADHH